MKKRIPLISLCLTMAVMLSACTGERVGGGAATRTERVKVIDVDLTTEEYGIGVDKDQPELLEEINAAIKEMQDDGEMDRIFSHYLGEGEPVRVGSAERDPSQDQLVVSSTLDFEPFEYGRVGEYYGIDMELVSHLADKLGKQLVIVNSSFEMMFLAVSQHKCDICIGGITINDKRRSYVDFSVPYFKTGQQVAVRADNTEFDGVTTADEVEGILRIADDSRTIGVESMTTGQYYCEGSRKEGYAGLPLEIRRFRDLDVAMQALVDEKVDYVIGDELTLRSVADEYNGVEN